MVRYLNLALTFSKRPIRDRDFVAPLTSPSDATKRKKIVGVKI